MSRPLRFVTNEGQPYQKRPRIIAACLTCRARKIKCSGEPRSCETCQTSGRICGGYEKTPNPKATQPSEAPISDASISSAGCRVGSQSSSAGGSGAKRRLSRDSDMDCNVDTRPLRGARKPRRRDSNNSVDSGQNTPTYPPASCLPTLSTDHECFPSTDGSSPNSPEDLFQSITYTNHFYPHPSMPQIMPDKLAYEAATSMYAVPEHSFDPFEPAQTNSWLPWTMMSHQLCQHASWPADATEQPQLFRPQDTDAIHLPPYSTDYCYQQPMCSTMNLDSWNGGGGV